MLKSDFAFELPESLIAQQPLSERTGSRLLVVDGPAGTLRDGRFADLGEWLRAGDLLVFNDTRVVPARLLGRKTTGARVEILLERIESEHLALCQVRSNKPLRAGAVIQIADDVRAELRARREGFFELCFEVPVHDVLQRHGRVPLPPYIRREAAPADRERYQTVFARSPGAVAAPTAGLHFSEDLLEGLAARGVERAFITLHVGAGTFEPVREQDLGRHRMHSERVEINAQAAEQVTRARAEGRRVVAVGTTCVRALESAWREERLDPGAIETRLFITPGYRFTCVDALITNFHLPESTLLMLVCAFGGPDLVMEAYRHAIAQAYRFYSYGDAMLVLPERARRGRR